VLIAKPSRFAKERQKSSLNGDHRLRITVSETGGSTTAEAAVSLQLRNPSPATRLQPKHYIGDGRDELPG